MNELLTFRGTIGRAQYLLRAIVSMIMIIVPMTLVGIASGEGASQDKVIAIMLIAGVCFVLGAWCSIVTEIRRWRDMGLSPWWFVGRAMLGWLGAAAFGSIASSLINFAFVVFLASVPADYFLSEKGLTPQKL